MLVYRQNLDRKLTSIEVDNNFKSLSLSSFTEVVFDTVEPSPYLVYNVPYISESNEQYPMFFELTIDLLSDQFGILVYNARALVDPVVKSLTLLDSGMNFSHEDLWQPLLFSEGSDPLFTFQFDEISNSIQVYYNDLFNEEYDITANIKHRSFNAPMIIETT